MNKTLNCIFNDYKLYDPTICPPAVKFDDRLVIFTNSLYQDKAPQNAKLMFDTQFRLYIGKHFRFFSVRLDGVFCMVLWKEERHDFSTPLVSPLRVAYKAHQGLDLITGRLSYISPTKHS